MSCEQISNPLKGLIANYDSGSEDEQTGALSAKVDDFLQEIRHLDKPGESSKTSTPVWEECFDETTGYSYYWNTVSNEVTWEMPKEYKDWLESKKVAPKTEPIVEANKPIAIEPSVKNEEESVERVKEKPPVKNDVKSLIERAKKKAEEAKRARSKKPASGSESEDEKITLITSYSAASSDEERSPSKSKDTAKVDTKPIDSDKTEKETVTLEVNKDEPAKIEDPINQAEKNAPISLVAGYGDGSEDESETSTAKDNETCLFPIEKTPSTFLNLTAKGADDSKTASATEMLVKQNPLLEDALDVKAFKRKRRIAVDVLKTSAARSVTTEAEVEGSSGDFELVERKGFGFSNEAPVEAGNSYSSKPGGIAFVKASSSPGTDLDADKSKDLVVNGVDADEDDEFKRTCELIKEKITFLVDGKETVSSVQIIEVQLQTLEEAYKAGALTKEFFASWLQSTASELHALEEGAAPEGWLCQWDRSAKRYIYRNALTGDIQTEYPKTDIAGGGEEMDISTTPPMEESPVSSPMVPSPAPSLQFARGTTRDGLPVLANQNVDYGDKFGMELDSFYNDLAVIESTSSVVNSSEPPQQTEVADVAIKPKENKDISDHNTKKRKKTKTKLNERLIMKKKGVSSLVEKWKKVQSELSD